MSAAEDVVREEPICEQPKRESKAAWRARKAAQALRGKIGYTLLTELGKLDGPGMKAWMEQNPSLGARVFSWWLARHGIKRKKGPRLAIDIPESEGEDDGDRLAREACK